ncbi:MAG: hypothetical protein VX764_07670 [Planctomycetota bacterium]|nr:hypothetical protein [Planctomycetota bacterium]
MKSNRRVTVAGGAITPFIGKFHPDFIWKKHPDFGTRENPTLEQLLHQVSTDACRDVGIDPAVVDRGYVGNFVGELFCHQGHLGALAAAADPGFLHTPFTRVEGACASGGLAIAAGFDAIQAGADVVLVAGVEVQTTYNAKDGADFLARASHYASERSIDPFTFPAMFARRTQAYCEKYGITPAALAPIIAKAYSNANRNPNAHMRSITLTEEQAAQASDKNPCFLDNEALNPWLRLSDCSQVSDGGCAVILCSDEGLQRLGQGAQRCVELRSCAVSCGPLGQVADYTEMDVSAAAARRAYSAVDWDPGDIQIAEVHDCFSISEALMCEALGLCGAGEGTQLAADGATSLDGTIPVNTGGGLMAFGHPVGATGVKQVYELFRQMNGLCGDYQVKTPPSRGVCANMGGDDRTAVVTLLEKN